LRKQIFHEWMNQTQLAISAEMLMDFFRTAMPVDTANRFVMNRNDVLGSVSFTACMVQQDATIMQYHHLHSRQVFSEKIKLE
jgi:hypothetical protein